MRIYLRDRSQELVSAWIDAFAKDEDVEVSHGDIFSGPRADCIVSPANSFGFMDGGIDAVYTHRFGPELSGRLRASIRAGMGGEVLVGQAVPVLTNDKDYPILISAPTMRIPMDISQTVNVFLAFRAALGMTQEIFLVGNRRPASILCPGLGTGVGGVPPKLCAMQMKAALDDFKSGPPNHSGLLCASERHARLMGINRSM